MAQVPVYFDGHLGHTVQVSSQNRHFPASFSQKKNYWIFVPFRISSCKPRSILWWVLSPRVLACCKLYRMWRDCGRCHTTDYYRPTALQQGIQGQPYLDLSIVAVKSLHRTGRGHKTCHRLRKRFWDLLTLRLSTSFNMTGPSSHAVCAEHEWCRSYVIWKFSKECPAHRYFPLC